MDNVRDIVLIVTGIVWSIVFLAVLVVVLVVFAFARKYLNAAHGFLDDRARAFLGDVLVRVEAVNQRTAQLAGHPLPPGIPVVRPAPPSLGLRLPFLRRRKPWWQKLLQR